MPGQSRTKRAKPASASRAAPQHPAAHSTSEARHEEAEHAHRLLADLQLDNAKHSGKKSVRNKT